MTITNTPAAIAAAPASAAVVTVSSRHLAEAMAAVSPAAATAGEDRIGRTMAHVHAAADGQWLHLLASDNLRLHYARIPAEITGPAQVLALPLELTALLRRHRAHTISGQRRLSLAGHGAAGLDTNLSGQWETTFPAVHHPEAGEDVAAAGRSMRRSLVKALDDVPNRDPVGRMNVSPALLGEALKAARGGARARLAQSNLHTLPDHRLLVSAPAGSMYGFRALLMGQRCPSGPLPLLHEHEQLRDSILATPGIS